MNRIREVSRTRIGPSGNKRKADISPKKVDTKKRSALGDLTNVGYHKNMISNIIMRYTTCGLLNKVLTFLGF